MSCHNQTEPINEPTQLREILELPEAKEMIEWLPGGEAFVVTKSFDLASQILPRYFKSGQYESFVRKLNRWGFRRESRGRRTGAFYHEHFIRDRPELMVHMSNRRAVANPRGLGPKHLRGTGGVPPPMGTAAAAAAAADRQHANATIGLGLGVGLDVVSNMSNVDFIALRHRQMARQHAAAAQRQADTRPNSAEGWALAALVTRVRTSSMPTPPTRPPGWDFAMLRLPAAAHRAPPRW